jgi:hypothetical protein
MRFPNPREVERAVYYGSNMRLKTIDALVRLSTWNASVGAKCSLQKPWVRVSNIPLDRRTDENCFYVGSLVGVSLDIDKPEFVRVLIGCRDVEQIHAIAEGCLGDNFYDFLYEVDRVVVGGPPKNDNVTRVVNSSKPSSPKRPRVDQYTSNTEETSKYPIVSSHTGLVGQVANCDTIPKNRPMD